TAPPGAGKSRLGQEVLRAVRERRDALAVWIGRGDSLRAGSPLGLLGQALRGACGLQGGEPIEIQRERVRASVADHVAEGERARVAEFLGEIIGAPFPDDDSLPLRAARKDAMLMTEHMQAAFIDFLAATCARRPA